jgi:glucuronokinase
VTTTRRVHSRAALAGNPSDGFRGAVCSVILPFFSASATIVEKSEGTNIGLVDATVRRFSREFAPVDQVGVAIETTIPRSVGLAGSSAIVIATIRALSANIGAEFSSTRIAYLAHTIEREDLDIAGGFQDQVIQSHGVSAVMDFSNSPSVTPLTIPQEPSIPLYLAWSTGAAEPSGEAHSALRAERDTDDPVWAEFAKHAYDAASALTKGNIHDLKAAIDATFDLRTTVMDIAPSQRAMIDVARRLGASANFAGSGGAIIGVVPKEVDTFMTGIAAAGLELVTWDAR